MPKKVIDRYDIEADREGIAVTKMNMVKPLAGKRTAKVRQKQARGFEIISTRVIKKEGWSPREML